MALERRIGHRSAANHFLASKPANVRRYVLRRPFRWRQEMVDSVVLDSLQDQSEIRLRLEGEVAGRRELLVPSPESASLPAGFDLRRAATEELKRSGISYVLISPDCIATRDVKAGPGAWGLAPVANVDDWSLYRID